MPFSVTGHGDGFRLKCAIRSRFCLSVLRIIAQLRSDIYRCFGFKDQSAGERVNGQRN